MVTVKAFWLVLLSVLTISPSRVVQMKLSLWLDFEGVRIITKSFLFFLEIRDLNASEEVTARNISTLCRHLCIVSQLHELKKGKDLIPFNFLSLTSARDSEKKQQFEMFLVLASSLWSFWSRFQQLGLVSFPDPLLSTVNILWLCWPTRSNDLRL